MCISQFLKYDSFQPDLEAWHAVSELGHQHHLRVSDVEAIEDSGTDFKSPR
jgi:hypothetical protein